MLENDLTNAAAALEFVRIDIAYVVMRVSTTFL